MELNPISEKYQTMYIFLIQIRRLTYTVYNIHTEMVCLLVRPVFFFVSIKRQNDQAN